MKKKALIAMLLACSFAFGTATMTACDLIGLGGNGETGQEQEEPQNVAVTGVEIDKKNVSIKVDETSSLTATVAPANATNQSVTWESSNNTVATVSQSGLVTAKSAGTATITVTTADGNKTDTCTVTVSENEQSQGGETTVAVTGVSLNKKTLPLTVNGTETLTATVAPANATNQSVTWESSNNTVATVSQSGLVTAKSAGTATITVTTADGSFTDTCTVTVTDATVAVTGVQLDKTTATAKVDDTVKLTATVAPANATNKDVTWSSGSNTVATVDQTGLVTAKSVGTAVITVTTADGNKSAICTVTVEAKAIATVKVTGVQLDKTTASIKVNETVKLTETISPANATNKGVTWQSGNTAVATVDQTGLVTAKSAGTATITVKTADGNYTASCALTVQQSASEPVVDAKISYSYAGNECAAFEWGDNNAAGATVQYKLKSAGSYTALSGNDKQYLVRQKDASTARVDFVGLKGGAVYDFKIITSSGEELSASDVTISSYDRSGYAHFGKSDGVGAYNNDGTPKNNAVIVYVNESNKNTVKATVNGKERTGIVSILQNAGTSTPLIVRIVGTVGAATWNKLEENGGKALTPDKVVGINNKSLVDYYNIVRKGNDGATSVDLSQATLIADGFNTLNTSVYSELNGLNSKAKYDASKDEFDSCWNDCSIQNVKNVTVEGIGEDARIFQWGMTFKNSSSIEVRNLTFEDYTEDACSFEGGDTSASSLSGFSHGNIWVHHNVFEEGMNYWDVCNEQDKHDGDGSTDFKGLKNITLSYNVYNDTHKTGLIGGSDSQSTASVTFHHNAYNNCTSRMPLGRQANMHMYNNYYNGSTGTNMSLRSNAYGFIENCYFDNANNPILLESGAAAKVLGCVFSGKQPASNSNLHIVTDRSEAVTNDNKFAPAFDISSSNFYYDATNQKSNVTQMLTAEETKQYVPQLAGVQKRGGDVTLGGAGGANGSTGGTGTGTENPNPGGETGTVNFLSQFDSNGKALEIDSTYFTVAGGKFKLNTTSTAILPNSDSTKSFTVTAKSDVKVTLKLAVSSGNAINTADATVTVSSDKGTAYNNLTFSANSSKLNGQSVTLTLKAGEVVTVTTDSGRLNIMEISYKV